VSAGRGKLGLTAMLLVCPGAFALNPALDISQYAHTAWRVREGFAKGVVWSVAQTPDGYLWLGTEFGLLRFDGVRAVQWTPPGEDLPSDLISRLLVTRDGRLWIGTKAGLRSWKDGRLTHYPALEGQGIISLIEDRQGSVWAGTFAVPTGRICAIHNGRVHCDGEDGSLGIGVFSLYEDRGDLWAGAATGLWRWSPGAPKRYAVPGVPEIQDLLEGDNGRLWIARGGGIAQLVDDRAEPYAVQVSGPFNPYKFLRDQEGGLWIATMGGGLVHLHQGRTDVFGSADGLSSDYVLGLFEDREGNIWAATKDGLDRFRDYVVPTISFRQGLSGKFVGSVLVARDGSVWLSTPDGLDRWDNGQITIYRKRIRGSHTPAAAKPGVREVDADGLPDNEIKSLYQDSQGRIWVTTGRGVAYFEDGRFVPVSAAPTAVYNIVEVKAGDLWINDYYRGLVHVVNGALVEQISWADVGRKDTARGLVADPVDGGLWLGFFRGGLAYFKDGRVRAWYAAAEGLGKGMAGHLRFDREGALWAATEGGLSRLKNGRITTLTSKNGLPCDAVQWTVEDDAQSVWLNTACGLLRVARSDLEAWVADSHHMVSARVFGSSDGVRSNAAGGGYSPRVAKSADGKLWFVTYDGASVIDPRHLLTNKLPPPVHIEQITADRKTYAASGGGAPLRLPPLVRDLEIDYTALSLVAPEKVRFRYKLEGRDSDWRDDVGNSRRAVYSDLAPRSYRFRVMASNNSGVWNEAGASFDFAVAPAYYQTGWFQAACAAAFLAVLVAIYQWRLRQVARHYKIRMEARVDERTRIARDLHDTLLQSFQGVLMKFSMVKYMIRDRPAEAEDTLDRAVEQARQAITEGRDAVQAIRSSTVVANDLARAISTLGEGLAGAGEHCPKFSVEVEGGPRNLPPILRDEVYQIACEALRNAFRHSGAARIDVALHYGERQLCLRVRDDGRGIDPKLLEGGRAGHYGLAGMKERAELVGGKLAVTSRVDAGTEIELTIPAAVAYARSGHGR